MSDVKNSTYGEVLDFIREQIRKGSRTHQLKRLLMKRGWDSEVIESCLSEILLKSSHELQNEVENQPGINVATMSLELETLHTDRISKPSKSSKKWKVSSSSAPFGSNLKKPATRKKQRKKLSAIARMNISRAYEPVEIAASPGIHFGQPNRMSNTRFQMRNRPLTRGERRLALGTAVQRVLPKIFLAASVVCLIFLSVDTASFSKVKNFDFDKTKSSVLTWLLPKTLK